jgi:hypothetical protein
MVFFFDGSFCTQYFQNKWICSGIYFVMMPWPGSDCRNMTFLTKSKCILQEISLGHLTFSLVCSHQLLVFCPCNGFMFVSSNFVKQMGPGKGPSPARRLYVYATETLYSQAKVPRFLHILTCVVVGPTSDTMLARHSSSTWLGVKKPD